MKWIERLQAIGVSRERFEIVRAELWGLGKGEPTDCDVAWRILNEAVEGEINYTRLKNVFTLMAVLLNEEGINSFEYQRNAYQWRLLELKEAGYREIEIRSCGDKNICKCYASGGAGYIDGLIELAVLPQSDCEQIGRFELCMCSYEPSKARST